MYCVKNNPNTCYLMEEKMSITKKILSVLTATLCAATASVCSISVSAEKTEGPLKDSNLTYVNVDEDEDGIYDHVRITGCDSSAESVLIPKAINDLVVKEIDPKAFSTAISLISIDVNSQNTYFSADDGILFDEQCPHHYHFGHILASEQPPYFLRHFLR